MLTLSLAELASRMKLKVYCDLCVSLYQARWGGLVCPVTPASSLEPAAPGRLFPVGPQHPRPHTLPPLQQPPPGCPAAWGQRTEQVLRTQEGLLLPKRVQAPGSQSSCLLMGTNLQNRRSFQLSLMGPLQRKPAKGHSKHCKSVLIIR